MVMVGIDLSKDQMDVHVWPDGLAFALPRTGSGLAALAERLAPLQPERVAVEATGGFESVVAAALAGAGLPVVVVNPAQVRHFARALGQRAKTDPIDAAMIARFVDATRPDLRPLADEATRLLADLVARRRQIIEMIVSEKNRERRAPAGRIQKSIQRLIAALEKELSSLDGDIDSAARRPGGPRRIFWPLCRGWVPPLPAPCWQNCRSWAAWTASASPAWRGLRRSRVSLGAGRAGA